MSALTILRLILAALLFAAVPAQGQSASPAKSLEPPLVLLVGDSTMAPDTGYGEALCKSLRESRWDCLNLARGGRSTKSYREEGLWDRALDRARYSAAIRPTLVLIQFGHNDQPGKPGRSTDLATEFPLNLERYVSEARAAGLIPILLSPLTRRSFEADRLKRDLAPWSEAVASVARNTKTPYIPLFEESTALVEAFGASNAQALAMTPRDTPHYDQTHVGGKGACFFSSLVYQHLRTASAQWTGVVLRNVSPECQALPDPSAWPQVVAAHPFWTDHLGWAVGTTGGGAGQVLRVTNLNADGPGSLRAAVEAQGPRIVVFEVSGAIDLNGRGLRVRNPYITIAGQTAPPPGITLVRGEFTVSTHDVIVQHLSFRPGSYGRAPRSGQDHDGLNVTSGAHKVIVDHCSFSWATDENLSVGGERFGGATPEQWRKTAGHEVTFSYNLIYEGLRNSVHPKGEHSKGSLIHDNASGIFIYRNLYVSNQERNPLLKGGVFAAVVNNLIYNPGSKAVHYNLIDAEWRGRERVTGRLGLVGNVLRHGPDTRVGTPLFSIGGSGSVELHEQDNRAMDSVGKEAPLIGRYTTSEAEVLPATSPYLPPRLSPLPAREVESSLMRAAGSRPWDRSSHDMRLLSDVAEGRSQIIDREEEVGGFDLRQGERRAFDTAQWNLHDMSPRAGWQSLLAPASR